MPISFCILITGSPTNSQAHLSALRFSKAVVKQGHRVIKVFFYQEAVHVANLLIKKPSDENQLSENWANFAEQNNIALEACITASERRGIINHENNESLPNTCSNMHPAFSSVGLAQLVKTTKQPELKLIHFK